jgi:hypothetical protein
MPYQYKREPLTQDEATRLANACETHAERDVVALEDVARLVSENLHRHTSGTSLLT